MTANQRDLAMKVAPDPKAPKVLDLRDECPRCGARASLRLRAPGMKVCNVCSFIVEEKSL
jgi:hypothetical protein